MNEEVKHIDYPLVAKAHPPMYLMHKFWARKPHNVVSEYIKHYSKEGDIILDPFVGSGVTAIEALKLRRKIIAIDLDPIATFITRMSTIPIDLKEIENEFERIKQNCERQIRELYETKCNVCGDVALILVSVWEKGKEDPMELRFFCQKCNKRLKKAPDKEDVQKIREIERGDIQCWYPKFYFPDGVVFNQAKREAGDYVYDLFTKRNLLALSLIYNEIEKIEDKKTKDLFRFTFTSMVHLASKMTPDRPSRPYSSFWAMVSYWIPPKFMESNVWRLFESAFKGRQGVLKGKEESNEEIEYYKEAKSFEDLKKDANILVSTQSALDLSNIPPNKIDYVFTDPPYGGAIPYMELSALWASWLKFDLDFENEITINEYQKKDFDYYHKMLYSAFREIYRVLKPERYLTVTFHSTEIKVWNSIIRAIILSGFNLEKIIYQPPPRTSSQGLLRPYGSAVGDYYIRFKKPGETKKILTNAEIDKERYKKVIIETAKKIIAERGAPTPYQYILNGIIPELDKNGVLLRGDKDVEDVMKEYLDKEFTFVPVIDEEEKVTGKLWWLKDPSSIKINLVPLNERVEKAVINVLNREIIASFDEVQQEVFITFPNALIPEKQSIVSVLKEYAEKIKGKWRLTAEVRVRESQHSVMLGYLAEIGKKVGYKVWIGSKEQGDIYNGKPLSKLSEKTLTLPIPNDKLDRIRNIDVLWIKDDKIEFEFEVENTTTITEAVVRGANIPYETKRYIIIPEERRNMISKKING